MCGIAAIAADQVSIDPKKLMKGILDSMAHRGPDASGIFYDSNVVLGHRRLSILDLSSIANQPMYSEDGRFVLILNGEIYNFIELRETLTEFGYKFRTRSDTEVLLYSLIHWGKNALERLNGMFSFILWDRETKEFFGARDRFGVKPLYYAYHEDHYYFSSEIRPLFLAGVPHRKNEKTWVNYLAHGTYGQPEETFWENIWQIPAGHAFTWQPGKSISIFKWYSLETRVREYLPQEISEHQAMEDYFNLMEDSLRIRLRSDVPVGINLSGGLDSSLLFRLVHSLLGKDSSLDAFTFTCNDPEYDELPWVRKMVQGYQHPLNVSLLKFEEVPELSLKTLEHQLQPYGGIPTMAYARLFEKAKEKNIPVLIDGQGMDEQWCGYDYYLKKENEAPSLVQGVATSPVRPNCLNSDIAGIASYPKYSQPFKKYSQNLRYRDLLFTKLPRALRFNDMVSMHASRELREPFLDFRLVELAFSLPDNYLIRDNVSKFLLREIGSKIIPDEISTAPKRPVQTPQREWLKGPLFSWVESLIYDVLLKKSDWFIPSQVKAELASFKAGKSDNSFYIWQWITLAQTLLLEENFHRSFNE